MGQRVVVVPVVLSVRGVFHRQSWLALVAVAHTAPAVVRQQAISELFAEARRMSEGVVGAATTLIGMRQASARAEERQGT